MGYLRTVDILVGLFFVMRTVAVDFGMHTATVMLFVWLNLV